MEKTATLVVGCCIAGGLLAVSPAAVAVVTSAVSLSGVLSAIGLRKAIKEHPECENALKALRRRVPREFTLANEADEIVVRSATDRLDRALRLEGLFTLEALNSAVRLSANVTEGLASHTLNALSAHDPIFAEVGLHRDLAESLFRRAFGEALNSDSQFRDRATLTVGEVTLAEVRQAAQTGERTEETVLAIRALIEGFLTPTSPDGIAAAALSADLSRAQRLPSLQRELAALPSASNLSAAAEESRSRAKAAMADNDIAGALRFMQEAEESEAQAEAEALKKWDRLKAQVAEAQAFAEAQSTSRAQGLAAHAAILSQLGSFEEAASLYERAISRLPSCESDLIWSYKKRLRAIFNRMAISSNDYHYTKANLLFNKLAADPDIYSFTILLSQSPDHATARQVLAEMTKAGIVPDVVTFNTLIAQAPDYPIARQVLAEMTNAGVTPDVVTFSILIAQAPDYPAARQVLAEMTNAGIVPDVVTFNTLIAQAPDYPAARQVLAEMTKLDIVPDVVTFSTLIAQAPDYPIARQVLTEMTKAGISPNVVTFSTLLARAPDYPIARQVLTEMTKAGISPNVVTFSTLLARAPDYPIARQVLAEMIEAGLSPNTFGATALAKTITTFEEASELRTVFRAHNLAGDGFYEAAFSKLCRSYAAKEILDWAFTGGTGLPFGAFGAAISTYRQRGRIDDALRIASAFPYLEAAKTLFRNHGHEAVDYLTLQYNRNFEPQNAARALGLCELERGNYVLAKRWLIIAKDHPLMRPAGIKHIDASLADVEFALASLP